MKLSVLVENTAKSPAFLAEHGLSIHINANGKNLLFDCGQTSNFIKNANNLDIKIEEVDFLVLSHGHYDHGGGLKDFLSVNKKAKVYLSKDAFSQHYNGTQKYIGLDLSLKDSDRLIVVDSDLEIADGFVIKKLKNEPFKIDSAGLTVKKGDEFFEEDFSHEQYLVVNENGKEYLFSGCTHKGLENVLSNFTPDVFVGGFHLSKLSPVTEEKRLNKIADLLIKTGSLFYTCHCTGIEQFDFLKAKLGDKLCYIKSADFYKI